MSIQNRKISLFYKYAILVLAFFSLISSFLRYNLALSSFNYFLTLSMIAIIVYYILAILRTLKDSTALGNIGITSLSPCIKGVLVVCSFINLFFILFSQTPINTSFLISVYLFPILIFIDWLLFDKKGELSIRDPLIWLFIPVGYYLYIILFAQTGIFYGNKTHYPYDFMNASIVGFTGVIKNMIILILVFFIMGYLFLLADTLLKSYEVKFNSQLNAVEHPASSIIYDADEQPYSYKKDTYPPFIENIDLQKDLSKAIDNTKIEELKKVIDSETKNNTPIIDKKDFPLLTELNILAKLKLPTEKDETVTIESLCAAINNVAQAENAAPVKTKTASAKRAGMPSASIIPDLKAIPLQPKKSSISSPYATNAFIPAQPSSNTTYNDPNIYLAPIVSYPENEKPAIQNHTPFSGVPLTSIVPIAPIAQVKNPDEYARCYAIPIQSNSQRTTLPTKESVGGTYATTFGATALTDSFEKKEIPDYTSNASMQHRPSYYTE